MTDGSSTPFTIQHGMDGTVAFDSLTDEQKASLKGEPGVAGAKGDKGDPGTTDYENLSNKPVTTDNKVAAYTSTVTDGQLRNIYFSTAEPTDSDGVDGDIWIVYEE